MKGSRRIDGLRLALALLAVFTIFPKAGRTQTGVAGFTPSSFAVSAAGAATFTIPIAIPPGIAGVEPKLAITYNSQGGNGILGVGWSLSGLSVVHRCPRTYAQDGAKGGINYDAGDRFCLDGQRLISIGTAAECASGIEYRTELESFARVISCDMTGGNSPLYFKVWTKGGQIMEYGTTGDSRIEAVPAPSVPNFPSGAVRAWALSKIFDRKGNYLTVSYNEDPVNGDFTPARIDYTGNASTTPVTATTSSVQFAYQLRSDVVPTYVGGSIVTMVNRLINVQTFTGSHLVRDYRIVYGQSSATSRSILTSITECSPGNACLPATVPTWQINPSGFNARSPTPWNAATLSPNDGWFSMDIQARVWPVDVNGDGLVDLMGVTNTGIYMQLNTGTAFANVSPPIATNFLPAYDWFHPSIHARVWPVDVDGDGLVDLLGVADTGVYAQFNTGTGFGPFGQVGPTSFPPVYDWFSLSIHPRVWPVDVNGDGRVDLLGVTDTGIYVQLNTGAGFGEVQLIRPETFLPAYGWFNTTIHERVWPVDVNGDGLVDLLGVSDSGVYVQLNTTTSLSNPSFGDVTLWNATTLLPGWGWFSTNMHDRVWPVDVNGDGLVDLLGIADSSGVYVQLNTGKSFRDQVQWNPSSLLPDGGWFTTDIHPRVWPMDVNGDGLVDLLGVTDTGVYVQLNTGASFKDVGPPWNSDTLTPTSQWFSTSIYPRVWPADVNGDGLVDLLGVTDTGVYVQLNSGNTRTDVVNSIQSGLGVVTSVQYKPLTDSSVYTKEHNASYPVLDIRSPLYVVSSSVTSNGIGGTFEQTTYTYTGAKADHQGRGFLGFHNYASSTLVDTNPQPTYIATSTTCRQDYPFVGIPSVIEKTVSGGGVLSRVENTLAATAYGGTRYFPYVSQSLTTSHDLNGALLPTLTGTTVYDPYGNPTSVVGSTSDGYSKTTINTYAPPDTANWFIGQLVRSRVTSTTPGP